MRIVICDDSARDREELKIAIEKLVDEYDIDITVNEYSDSEQFFDALSSELKLSDIQVVFMDVYMGEEMGTDAVKKLKDMGYEGSVIFCTNSEDHALESYKLKADGYLVKPFTYEDFKESTWRLSDILLSAKRHLHFIAERMDCQVELDNVLFIETENKGCRVHTTTNDLFTWQKLSEFQSQVGDLDYFYCIGRSFIINLNHISKITDENIIMKNSSMILIPSRSKKSIKQDINNYFLNKARSTK